MVTRFKQEAPQRYYRQDPNLNIDFCTDQFEDKLTLTWIVLIVAFIILMGAFLLIA